MSNEPTGEERKGSMQKVPVSISDLLGDGATFQLDIDYDAAAAELFAHLTDDHRRCVSMVSPWLRPFDDLRPQMVEVEPYLWKRLVRAGSDDASLVDNASVVDIHYNGFFEGEEDPFDSTYNRGRPTKLVMSEGTAMDGIDGAIRTMKLNEQAEFLIGHQLLFGELGCPPRIKPRATALYVIELVAHEVLRKGAAVLQTAAADDDDAAAVEEEDEPEAPSEGEAAENTLPAVERRVRELHASGKDFFKRHMFGHAVRVFERGVALLEHCRIADERDEQLQGQWLLKLYTNLAVCYNKVSKPKRVCIMCKHIRRLTDNKPPCKALYQEGRALLMLHEYERSRALLRRAAQLEPNDPSIAKELHEADKCIERNRKTEQRLLTQAMQALQLEDKQKKQEADKSHGMDGSD